MIATYSAGTVIERDFYIAAHQWATVPLAEASMLLFLVMFAMSGRGWRKWVFFTLAFVATAFVLVANAGAGLGLESLLAPVFTIGVGLHLEGLIVRQLERRSDVNTRYLAALSTWEAASQDATKHPDYVPILKQEVWARLIALSTNKPFSDATAALKHAAVRREMERDTGHTRAAGRVCNIYRICRRYTRMGHILKARVRQRRKTLYHCL